MNLPKYIQNDIQKLYKASKNETYGDINQRKKGFFTLFKIYYPWATRKELNKMHDLIIPDEIEYDCNIWAKNTSNQYKKDIIKLFGVIDKDSSGGIDINEFKLAVQQVSKLEDKIIEDMFKKADKDNNKILDIKEFIQFISKNSLLRKNFSKILEKTYNRNKEKDKNRLSILFKNLPESPIRINWRPSLANLKSPTKIRNSFYMEEKIYSAH